MFQNKLSVNRAFGVILILAGLTCASCSTVGPRKLVSSHTAYNDAVQLTVTREVLSNIVRSRYSDPMTFITVSAINAQFSVSVGGTAGAGGIGQAGTAGQAAGSVGYSDSPTITYIPQSDNAFYNSFYGLFDVSEALGFGLSYRFARSDPEWQALSLRFSFSAINGADDFIGGKYSERYNRRVNALVRLFQLGAVYRQVPEWDFDSLAIPKWKVTAEDTVWAFRMGFFFIEEDGGENVRLARYRMVMALALTAPDDPQVIEALEDLGVPPGRKQYIFRPPMHATPGAFDPEAIWVTPRSMADIVSLAARFVDVPAVHDGIVPPLEPLLEDPGVIPQVRIHSSEEKPPFPYRVRHRGYWFYVDDSEVESKIFLEAMVAAYSSRLGSKQAGEAAPQVVLPVGGG